MDKRSIILRNTVWSLLLLLGASCTNEWDDLRSGQPLREGEIALQWLPANMGIHHVKTRGTDPKTAEEQKINNVHVFVFDAAGKYLTPEGNDAFQGYSFVPNSQNIVLSTELFGDQSAAEHATVVVLANMPENYFKVRWLY